MRRFILFVCALMLTMYVAIPAIAEDKKATAESLTSSPILTPETAGIAAKPVPDAGAGEVVIGLTIPLLSPLFSDVPLAKVNDERVTLKEVRDAVIASHKERTEETAAKKMNYAEILDRLINLKLILQEAREMGIDELPEVKEAISVYGKQLRKDLLLKRATKNAKANPAEVERIYRDMIREWKIKSVLFFRRKTRRRCCRT